MIRYAPYDHKISTLIQMMGDPLVIYTSCVDHNLNFYGLGMFYGISKENRSLPSLEIFDFIDFSSDDFFVFKTMNFRFLEPVLRNFYRPFLLHRNSIFFVDCEEESSMDGWEISAGELPFPLIKTELVDSHTHDFNPLNHLLSFDRSLDKNKRSCLISAIHRGFPYKSTEDLIESSEEIENAADILQASVKEFAELNITKFLSIAKVLTKNPVILKGRAPSTRSLLLFIEKAYPNSEMFSEPKLPRMFIKSITVDAIFELKGESVEIMRRNLMSKELTTGNIEVTVSPAKSHRYLVPGYKRYRFTFKWDFGQFPIEVHQIPYCMNDFEKFKILSALSETDEYSYLRYKKKRSKEFWIRSACIVIFVSNEFSKIAEKTVKGHFFETILCEEGKPPLWIETYDADMKRISFEVYLRPYYDYVISEREEGLFFHKVDAFDQLTLEAVEHARKRKFEKALEILEKGRCSLEADLLIWKYKNTGSSDVEIFRRAKELYSKGGIKTDGVGPYYLRGKTPGRIMKALRRNLEWKNSILLYMGGANVRKKILENPFTERICSSISNVEFVRRCFVYSDLVTVRDTVDFVDNLSSFYAKMLSNIQKKSKEMTAMWTFSSHL